MSSRHFLIPFGAGLLGLLGLVLLPLAAALLGIGWYATARLEEAVLAARIETLESTIAALAEQGMLRFCNTQQALADSGIYSADAAAPSAADAPGRRALLNMLDRHPNMTAGYVGFADGSFLYVARVDRLAETRRQEIGAPTGAAVAVRTIGGDGSGRLDEWTFFTAAGAGVAGRPSSLPDYDPRARSWFTDAIKAGQPVITEPYAFAGAGGIGITIATPLRNGAGVIGADLTLTSLSRWLAARKVSPSSLIVVATGNGGVLARTDLQSASASTETADWMLSAIRGLAAGGREAASGIRAMHGVDMRLQVRALPSVFGQRFYLAIAAPVPELTVETGVLITRSAVVAAVAVLVAFIGGIFASRLLSGPLARIADKTDQFRQLDFSDVSRIGSRVREISRLDAAVEQMRGGLEQFSRYVPRQLVRRVIDSPAGAEVGGARQAVTVMFTDIEHFTHTAETMDPEQLISRLSKYLESLGGVVMANGGTIDKYIGDSIMAIWNAPEADADHVAKACRAALAAARTSEWLEAKWQQRGRPLFHTRCGLNTGVAVVGNVGSLDRMNYTVIGAVPNAASRLEGLNKVYGTRILASGPVFEAVRRRFTWREIDKVVPAGAVFALDVYELMGDPAAPDQAAPDDVGAFLEQWNAALACYRRGDMPAAAEAFRELARAHPSDGPSRTFAARCALFLERGLPEDWNGVTVFREK